MERLSLNRWASPWLRHQHIARYRWVSTLTRNGCVLDAACGTGYGTRMVIENGARRVDGVDVSEQAIGEARRPGRAEGLTFLVGDATRLPLRGGLYDVYLCFETIEHVREDRSLLAEAARVLRPGGTFVCSTPNRSVTSPGRSIRDRPFNPFHCREYVQAELDALLRPYFRSVELYGQTFFDSRYADALVTVGRRLPRVAIRLHQMRKILGLPGERLERHLPGRLPLDGKPETLIAVCTT